MHPRKVAVIGLGYVGLPAAVAFSKHGRVIGFDKDPQRILELQGGHDRTEEVSSEELHAANIFYTDRQEDLKDADFFIIAVPTPVDEDKSPDLMPVLRASKSVGSVLKTGDIVVYESTVYPGATEEVCIPVLERCCGLSCGSDFSVGYSPERINPGDKEHSFSNTIKIVSGLDADTLDTVAAVYESVVTAGVHRAPTIKVAEAAKVIENTQRDLNIAIVNELAKIFDRLSIDTHDVLAAAGSKWNFLPFKPGLVGGHCIGIDPYYLINKAHQVGYDAQLIRSGRLLNDSMGEFIATRAVDNLVSSGYLIPESTITVLGLSFKENVPDLRNTRVVDIVQILQKRGIKVQVHDPHVDAEDAKREHGIQVVPDEALKPAQCVILAVAHREYIEGGWQYVQALFDPQGGVLMDVKGVMPRDIIPPRLRLWRL